MLKTNKQNLRPFAMVKNGTQLYIDGVLVIKIRDKKVMTHDGAVVDVPNNTLVKIKR